MTATERPAPARGPAVAPASAFGVASGPVSGHVSPGAPLVPGSADIEAMQPARINDGAVFSVMPAVRTTLAPVAKGNALAGSLGGNLSGLRSTGGPVAGGAKSGGDGVGVGDDRLNGLVRPPAIAPRNDDSPIRLSNGALPLLVMGLVVISWGVGPPFAKLLTAPPMASAVIRFAMSTPFLLAILALRGRWLSRRVFVQTALPGMSFGINMVFVFAAVQEVTISVMSVMMALQPAMLLAVVGPLFGDRISPRQIAFTLLGVVGAMGVIAGAGGDFRASGFGLFLTAMSVLTFTVYFVLTRVARSSGDVDPIEWMAGINFWSLVAALPPTFLWVTPAQFATFGGKDWLWIVIVAFVTGVFGHVLMTWCHGHIEVARSSLYVLAMHLVAVGLAWLIHSEPVTMLQFAAGAVVLGSVALVIRTPASPGATSDGERRSG